LGHLDRLRKATRSSPEALGRIAGGQTILGRRGETMTTYAHALAAAVEAARAAGDLLRADFHRPGGARGSGDHADADAEAERLIRQRLLAACPGWGYLGEERRRGQAGPA
jgi:hypothetical protein